MAAKSMWLQSPRYRDRTQLTPSLLGQDPNDKPCLLTGFHKSPGLILSIILGFGAPPAHFPAVLNPLSLQLYPKSTGKLQTKVNDGAVSLELCLNGGSRNLQVNAEQGQGVLTM